MRDLFAIFIGISVVSGVVSVLLRILFFSVSHFIYKMRKLKAIKKCLPSAEQGRPVMSDPYDWLIASKT